MNHENLKKALIQTFTYFVIMKNNNFLVFLMRVGKQPTLVNIMFMYI